MEHNVSEIRVFFSLFTAELYSVYHRYFIDSSLDGLWFLSFLNKAAMNFISVLFCMYYNE